VAAGLGAGAADTIGDLGAVADYTGQGVVLSNVAVVGARPRDLGDQVSRAVHYRPHVAVIIIGERCHPPRPQVSVRYLAAAVRRLREQGIQVVMGTTPDLGTIPPFRPPLQWLAREWSRTLAAAQAVAVVQAGGRAVSLGDLLGPEFAVRHSQLFSADRFHPSNGATRQSRRPAPAV
jgi:hypothetical protein